MPTARRPEAGAAARSKRSARDLLRTGEFHLGRPLAIKRGEVPWPHIESWFTRLASETAAAARHTTLPPDPDTACVEDS
ncbi:hypothetical protein [Streptomyces sp. NBC_01262]|uniref:hypothetical protein n=1 Tax=Streptomyces sp. NBC_01262 TaxID=2903803 RepID=UPI002E3321BE|nr:hypothetical protein [Streptomyces sp. NBC_01262]